MEECRNRKRGAEDTRAIHNARMLEMRPTDKFDGKWKKKAMEKRDYTKEGPYARFFVSKVFASIRLKNRYRNTDYCYNF